MHEKLAAGARVALVAFFALCALLMVHALPAQAATAPIVKTEYGPVIGPLREGVYEYRGIPYAAAPVGQARWTLPKPPQPWNDVRPAMDFGPACAQEARFELTQASEAEDCLTINVSVPRHANPKSRLPVLVWIHGGAFVGGSSSLYRLDRLAREANLVVVSMNYRVGVLGFMPHPAFEAASNGNLGLEDQRMALRWVRRNIANFGGNPENVTLAGESAGGASVCMHLSSPEQVKGLFHKAIILSAPCLSPVPTLQQALQSPQASWRHVAADLGCPTGEGADSAQSLQCMRQASVQALLKAQGGASSGVLAFTPVAQSPSVPRSPEAAADANMLLRVPLMIGAARNELRLYMAYAKLYPPNLGVYDEQALRSIWLPLAYGTDKALHDAILAEYGRTPMDGAALGSMLSDFNPKLSLNNCMTLRTADRFVQRVPKLFQFEFTDAKAPVLGVGIAKGRDPGFDLGAVHSSALGYFFPGMSNTSAMDAPALPPASEQLARKMVAYWAAFARTGSPAAPGLPAWPRYAGGSTVMQWDPDHVGLIDSARHHRCEFWRGLFPG
jgi:para-nitrobenzyl esterase